jgi:hypothetical protein
MPTAKIDRAKLAEICRRNDVRFLGLFGSFAHGDAMPESDIDLLARFSRRKSLIDLVRIEREMAEALERAVDLVTEASLSPHLRDRILDDVQAVYDEDA